MTSQNRNRTAAMFFNHAPGTHSGNQRTSRKGVRMLKEGVDPIPEPMDQKKEEQ